METRAPKGRGKRGRGAGTPVSAEKGEGRKLRKGRRGSTTFTAPPSPARSDISTTSTSSKRKARGLDPELSAPSETKLPKRSRSAVRGSTDSPKLIECPEPNCEKRYKHQNGLRYHMTNHHGKSDFNMRSVMLVESSDKDEEEEVGAANQKDNKSESSKDVEMRDREDNSPIEDDLPLKEIMARSAQQERSKAAESSKAEVSKPNPSPKKRDMVATPTTTAPSVSTTPISLPKSTPPVFHLPGTSVTCLGTSVPSMMTQPAIMSTATVTCASAVSGMPICMTTSHSTVDLVKQEPMAARADQRSKQKSMTRPIVPAPMPLGGLGSPASVSQSSMSPVSAHGQVSPSLKPIQPKPTILGEMPPNRDPLVGLNNVRTKTKKKTKKETGSSIISSPGTPKQPGREGAMGKEESLGKCDRPAVIQSIPSPSRMQEAVLRKEPVVNVPDIQKFSADLQRTGATSATVISAQVASAKAIEVAGMVSGANAPSTFTNSGRLTQPLNSLNPHQVHGSLQISTADRDRKTPVSENALSPAYSDISDANDSGSPQGSPQKKDESIEGLTKKDHTASPTLSAPDVRPYHDSVYNYPYQAQILYSQSALGAQMSTGSVKPMPMGKDGGSSGSDKKLQRSDDMRKSAPCLGLMMSNPIKVEDVGEEGKSRKSDVELQMMQFHQLQALQMIQQDPAYPYPFQNRCHALNRAKLELLHRSEPEVKTMEPWPPSVDAGSRDLGLSHPKYQQPLPFAPDRERDNKMSPSDIQEHNLREKQNENHQILKENIELKSQMLEKNHMEQQYQRYSLFQAQKMVSEHQKLNKPPPKLQSSEVSGVKVSSHSRSLPEVVKVDDGPRDFHRKDLADSSSKAKDGHRDLGKSSEGQQLKEDKSRPPDGSQDMKSKASSMGMVSTGGGPIASTSAGSAPVVSFAPNPPFLYNFSYPTGPVPMFNYSQFPQHPSALHLFGSAGPVDVEKEKGEAKAKRGEVEGKGVEPEPQGSQFYTGSMHKIHELGEKTLPSGGVSSSPQPLKGSDSVMSTQGGSGGDKGREYSSPPSNLPTQRHYHTHHHTHVVRSLPPTYYSQENYNGILTSQASIAHTYPPK